MFTKSYHSPEKYIICNADEGDPEPLWIDQYLKGSRHVIEAMAIGGYAIGANKGFIYIRANTLWQYIG